MINLIKPVLYKSCEATKFTWSLNHLVTKTKRLKTCKERKIMNQEVVITIMQNIFVLILELSAPVLIVSVVIGLIVSVFQTITQIQESTLTFVPKIIAGVVTLIILMPWMLNVFVSSVRELFSMIPSLL